MAQAEVGALRVVLGMDMAEFAEGAKKAMDWSDKLAQKFGLTQQNLERAALAISAAFVAAAAGIAIGMKSAIDRADELSKLSQKIGVPIEQLSALAYAADLADVELQDLGTGLKKLDVNLSDIASGDKTGTAARALTALGISATTANGAIRPTADVLRDVAEKFAGLKDDAGKTAIAVALFGKQGANLIPLLNAGAAGLKEMEDRARAMGLVLDSETGKAAEEFNDRLKDLEYGFKGLLTRVGVDLLPLMNQLTQAFADWVRGGDGVEPAAKRIGDAFRGIATAVLISEQLITEWGIRIAGTVQQAYQTLTLEWTEAAKTAEITNLAIKKSTEDTAKAIAKLNVVSAVDPKANQTAAKANTPLLESTQALADAQKELNKSIADGVSLAKSVLTPYQKLGIQIDNLGDAYAAGKISADAFALAQKKAMEDAEIAFRGGAELIAKNTSPYEQMQETIRKLTDQFNAGAISATAFGQAQQQAALTAAQAYASGASSIAGSLTQVFSKSKGVAIASAIINAFQAATNALAQVPYPLNFAAAAAALAAGFVQVQNIRRTTENSSGGGGGGGSAAAPAGPTQTPQTLRVEGINPNALFTGSSFKTIAQGLLDYQRDGGQVVLA